MHRYDHQPMVRVRLIFVMPITMHDVVRLHVLINWFLYYSLHDPDGFKVNKPGTTVKYNTGKIVIGGTIVIQFLVLDLI